VHAAVRSGRELAATLNGAIRVTLRHELSPRQVDLLLAGGVINWLRQRLAPETAGGEPGDRAPVIAPG
jgi:aconitate hydratase